MGVPLYSIYQSKNKLTILIVVATHFLASSVHILTDNIIKVKLPLCLNKYYAMKVYRGVTV
jgi:hypothetical protein